MLAKGTVDHGKVIPESNCASCKTLIGTDRYVPVEDGVVHRDCHDTWLRKQKSHS